MPIQAAAIGRLTDRDRAAIQSGIAKFDKDVLAGDWHAVASAYTHDAVLLPPHASMVRGRMAIQRFFEALPKFTEFSERPVEIEGEGEFAFPWGTYETVVDTGDKDRGKVLAIWHKQADGTWLVSRVCWNSDLAPAT